MKEKDPSTDEWEFHVDVISITEGVTDVTASIRERKGAPVQYRWCTL